MNCEWFRKLEIVNCLCFAKYCLCLIEWLVVLSIIDRTVVSFVSFCYFSNLEALWKMKCCKFNNNVFVLCLQTRNEKKGYHKKVGLSMFVVDVKHLNTKQLKLHSRLFRFQNIEFNLMFYQLIRKRCY